MAEKRTVEIQISVGEAQKELDRITDTLEEQKQITSEFEAELVDLERQLKNVGSWQKRENLKKRIDNLKDSIKEQKVAVKDLTQEQRKANQTLKEAKDNQADLSGLMGILDQQTGGVISKFRNFSTAMAGATKGAKLLRVALISTGIGAVAVAIGSLIAAFKNSEKGQNALRKRMLQIGTVFGNVQDILEKFGGVIISVFKGKFREAGKQLKEITQDVKNFGEETRKELEIANQIADARAKADVLERELITKRAEATRVRNDMLEKAADRERYTAEERIAFLQEAAKVEQEITDQEIAAAKIRFETKKQENALSESTKEDLDEEAQLQARLTELEAMRLRRQKTLTSQISAFRKEAEAERKAEQRQKEQEQKEADAEELAREKELADLKKAIRDAEANTEEEQRQLKLTKLQEYYDELIAKAEKNNLDTVELERTKKEALEAQQQEFDAKDEAAKQKKIEDDKKIAEEQKQLELDKIAARDQSFDRFVQIAGAETQVGRAALVAKQLLKAREMVMNLKADLQAAKSTVAKATLNAAEGGTEIAKGASKAASILPPPLNIPTIIAYAAQAAGIIGAIKQATGRAKSVASSIGAGGGATPNIEAPRTAAVVPQAPAFNIVGASGTDQLAQAIGGQTQRPIKTYVVSDDVSTAQSLDRNIVEGASIG